MILVTGGTGLVGSHLLYDLTKAGKRVRAIKRPHSNLAVVEKVFRGNTALWNNIEWVPGDVLDVDALSGAMQEVTHVYHAAALVSFDPSDRNHLIKINTEGTANVVNLAREAGVKKMCVVSSIASLGRNDQTGTTSEESAWTDSDKNSAYAVSKHLAEREVWRGVAEGLDAVIVHPSVIIGPGDWSKGSCNLFTQAWKGIGYFSNGMNGFVDVRDVTKAMILLMNSPISKERFIVSSENCTYKEIFSWITAALGKPAPEKKLTPLIAAAAWRLEAMRAWVTGHKPLITRETARTAQQTYKYSNQKITNTTGMTFIPVEQSVKETCALFLKDLENKR